MGRPEVTLENYEAVRKFYSGRKQGPRASWVGHMAMGAGFRTNFSFDEGTPEAIKEVLDSGWQLVVAPKHSTAADQYVMAGMATRLPVLRPLMGVTIIPSKASLFHDQFPIPKTPWAINFPPLRYAIDEMGAIPVFRPKDVDKMAGDPKMISNMRKENNTMIEDIVVEGLNTGKKHLAIFGEGTRNLGKSDPKEVQELKPGIGRMVSRVLEDIESGKSESKGLAVLPVGLYYGEDEDRNIWTPFVHVGTPEVDLPAAAEQITDLTAYRMQGAQDLAVQAQHQSLAA